MVRGESLYFTGPNQVQIEQSKIDQLASNQILVQAIVSGISPGTEMLMYRGQFPEGLAADSTIDSLAEPLAYPFKYGYAMVGQIIECGAEVDKSWLNQRVFAFHPHESHFITQPEHVIPLPDEISSDTAVLLPNMETAVSFIMDGQPAIGEKVFVIGQGIVGLLTTALLAQFPVQAIITADFHTGRREWAKKLGATASYHPVEDIDALKTHLHTKDYQGADLSYELSGNPKALNLGVELTGYNGRLVIGSWYGQKTAPVQLGGHFHRSQMQIISSQVSLIAPQWNGRWSKSRRFELAMQQLTKINVKDLITHKFDFASAPKAYKQLANHPESTLQILFTY
ncbi:MAG: zinc-binding alcohol dehydrogenase [Chloroflexota bacterium]